MTSKLVLSTVGGDLEETVALVGGVEISAGAGEVVVDVEAAPINGADPLFAMGRFGVHPEVPADMGAEGVDRVAEVGPGVDPALVGRRVVLPQTFRFGTWATRTVAPTSNVVPVPEEADPLQPTVLAVNPATACVLLHGYADLGPGDRVGLQRPVPARPAARQRTRRGRRRPLRLGRGPDTYASLVIEWWKNH
ncbi:alcohol dehydrogenase catalytic domain-containing protein [Streptomyces sp. NPDC004520]|uniref:alcohol dehydrogenase catalytic domain-containing protein n=1 Tax=Streptomyces sp. NPDC004520 TaxID=3364702 RepID=UPI0036B445AC